MISSDFSDAARKAVAISALHGTNVNDVNEFTAVKNCENMHMVNWGQYRKFLLIYVQFYMN